MNKANSSNTEAPFLDLDLSITNGIVSSKIYDKRDDFNLEIVNLPFLDGDVSRSPSYGICISQLIRFARVFSNVDDFNKQKAIFDCYFTLLCLSSCCLMIVVWLFLTMPWICLHFVIVVFSDDTHILLLKQCYRYHKLEKHFLNSTKDTQS